MGGEMMPFIDQAKALLSYDPATGLFSWLVKRNSRGGAVHPGEVAGTPKDGYVQIKVAQQLWRAHRLAWLFMTGALPPKGHEIDHINGNRSDNRWCNLRLVTRAQNNMNLGISKANVSGTKGVSWIERRQKWLARVKAHGAIYHLGEYAKLEDAVAARKAGEIKHCGDFARRS